MTDVIYEDELPRYVADVMATHESAEYTEEMDWWNTLMSSRDQQSFGIGGVPGGSAWPEWELQTFRTQQLGNHDTLVATGRLMKSVVRGGQENVDEVGPRKSMFGTAVDYAGKHQEGGEFNVDDYLYNRQNRLIKRPGDKINLPQRPFATLTNQMVDGLAELVSDSLVEQMKG